MPWITPEKSEEFIKILERHPEHKTGDMSAAWREWQELNGIEPDGSVSTVRHLLARRRVRRGAEVCRRDAGSCRGAFQGPTPRH